MDGLAPHVVLFDPHDSDQDQTGLFEEDMRQIEREIIMNIDLLYFKPYTG